MNRTAMRFRLACLTVAVSLVAALVVPAFTLAETPDVATHAVDAKNAPEYSLPLNVADGTLGPGDTGPDFRDVYKVFLHKGANFSAQLDSPTDGTDFDLYLYDNTDFAGTNPKAASYHNASSEESFVWHVTKAGYYYLDAYSYDDPIGRRRLHAQRARVCEQLQAHVVQGSQDGEEEQGRERDRRPGSRLPGNRHDDAAPAAVGWRPLDRR